MSKFTYTASTPLPEMLAAMQAGQVTIAEFTAWDASRSVKVAKLYCKVSEKGAVSVYGNGQWPTTLYREQWERLLVGCPADHFVLAFIAAHAHELSKGKEDSAARGAAAEAAKAAAKAAADATAARKAVEDQAVAEAVAKRFSNASLANAAAKQEVKF